MHAVMRAVIAAPAQLLEQPLGRPPLPPAAAASASRISVRTAIHSPSFGAGCTPRAYLNSVSCPRTTLRTVARDTDSVRTISLIGRRCSK
jgi:hypothetical protein